MLQWSFCIVQLQNTINKQLNGTQWSAFHHQATSGDYIMQPLIRPAEKSHYYIFMIRFKPITSKQAYACSCGFCFNFKEHVNKSY